MFSKILVPLDGSKLAELALPYAEELVDAFSSELDLLYVCEPAHRQNRYEHQVYVDKMAEQVRNHTEEENLQVKVKSVALDGHPAAEIIDYTDRNDINLIAMATHGRSGIMSWAMGSVANKVLQKIKIPILLIRAILATPEVSQEEMFSQILLPLDGSDAGEAALPYVKELTEKLKVEVILLQVIASGHHVHTIGGLDFIRFSEQQVASVETEARHYLEEVSRKLAGAKATIRAELRFGDPAKEIIKFAGETDTRLVAMSTHGHSGIEQWTFGSITHKVLHNSNTPLLLVRAPGVQE